MNIQCSLQLLILYITVQGLFGQDCRDVPCANNGLCIRDELEQYSCKCLEGFAGQFCKSTSRECDSSICLDHGECVQNIQTNKITCVCDGKSF